MTIETKKITFSLKDLIAFMVFISTILWNYFSFKSDITVIKTKVVEITEQFESSKKKIDKMDRFLLSKFGDTYEFVNKVAETKRTRGIHVEKKDKL